MGPGSTTGPSGRWATGRRVASSGLIDKRDEVREDLCLGRLHLQWPALEAALKRVEDEGAEDTASSTAGANMP